MARLKARKPLIGLALVALFGIAVVQHYRPAEAWKVWKEEGPSACLSYLKDPRTSQEKFIRAWSFYNQEKLKNAIEIVTPHLELRVDAKTKGDFYFLAGLIASYSHAPDTMEYFARAIEIYLAHEAYNSLFTTYLSMADYMVSTKDLWLAENYLEKVRSLPASNPNLAYFHEVLSEFFVRNGDYEEALDSSRSSLEMYRERDINAVARVLSDIGFIQLLLGRFKEGMDSSFVVAEFGIGDWRNRYVLLQQNQPLFSGEMYPSIGRWVSKAYPPSRPVQWRPGFVGEAEIRRGMHMPSSTFPSWQQSASAATARSIGITCNFVRNSDAGADVDGKTLPWKEPSRAPHQTLLDFWTLRQQDLMS